MDYMKSFIEKDEILNEGLISSTFSTASALYIIKLLLTKWDSWDAYNLDLIDNKGKRTEKEASTKEEKESLNLLNQFVMGLRRIFLTFMSENILKFLVTVYIVKGVIKK